MLGLIFSANDSNYIEPEEPTHRTKGPVNLKFLFGFDMMGREKGNVIREDSSEVQPERVIYVFLK